VGDEQSRCRSSDCVLFPLLCTQRREVGGRPDPDSVFFLLFSRLIITLLDSRRQAMLLEILFCERPSKIGLPFPPAFFDSFSFVFYLEPFFSAFIASFLALRDIAPAHAVLLSSLLCRQAV